MIAEELVARLDGVRKIASGWSARCPGHEDRRQSLSVSQGQKGVLLKCFAGCATKDILAKLNLKERDLFPHDSGEIGGAGFRGGSAELDAIYPYHNETGSLAYQVVRKPGKRFFQRRPDGKGGWITKLDGVRRVPYRLPELLRADTSAVVFIPEGEKDVESLSRLGEVATTNPGGTGSGHLWNTPSFMQPLHDRVVVILPDNDEPGRKHSVRVASVLHGHAKSVKVLALPDLPEKGDISDWIATGGTRDKLNELVTACRPWTPPAQSESAKIGNDEDEGDRERPGPARLIVSLAEEHAELFNTPDTDVYFADVGDGDTLAIKSNAFEMFLVEKYFDTYDKTASENAYKQAIKVLLNKAKRSPVTRTVALRVGAQDGHVFVDLCEKGRRVVEIQPGSWRLVDSRTPPLRFRRTPTMRALPEPARGGSVDELRPFLNIGDDESRWQLMLAWLLFALQPKGPFPPLVLQGEHGSAKSTVSRVLRELVDPSQATVRHVPKDRDVDTVMLATKNSWVLIFDNLSGMPTWLAEILCGVATGTAQTKRALYSNDEEIVFEAQRPVIVNGIDDMTARPDFASRALPIELPTIHLEERRTESEFWAAFREAQPRILGALFSVEAAILAILPKVEALNLPRMADFGRFGLAAEKALGWKEGSFLAALKASDVSSAAVGLESNLVATAVYRFMTDSELNISDHEDTATALLPRLAAQLAPGQERSRAWPSNAAQLGNQLRRCAPILRNYGIDAQPKKVRGERIWRFRRMDPVIEAETPSPSSPLGKREQMQLLGEGSQGDGRDRGMRMPRDPEACAVTAGDGGVTADNGPPSRRWRDGGDGGDGTISNRSEEEEGTNGCLGASPSQAGGRS